MHIDPQSLTWRVTRDLLAVIDSNGVLIQTNPAWQQTLGWSAEQIDGYNFFEFLHPDDIAESERELASIRGGAPVLGLENRYRHKDGGYRWLSWNAVPEGEFFLCSARDVTKAKENAMSLATREEEAVLREQFVAVLGHDLRNPVAAVDAAMRLLLRQPQTPEAQQTIALAQGSVRTMSALIDNLMDFARARLGKGLELGPLAQISLKPVLAQAIQEFRVSYPSAVIEEDYDIATDVPCDPVRIGQMVSNLIRNAVTHGAADTPIAVTGRIKDGDLTIAVSNAGAPIPAEALPTLFEPFSRQNQAGSPEGLGLGLFICHQIALSHGGGLTVTSDDERTVFTFVMPLQSAD